MPLEGGGCLGRLEAESTLVCDDGNAGRGEPLTNGMASSSAQMLQNVDVQRKSACEKWQ